MYIESIDLKNFRNYESAALTFSPDVNIFFGDNAQGKTNLLEAVYLASTSASHRSRRDKDLIHFNHEEAHIRLFFNKNNLTHKLDFHLRKKGGKGIALDGVPLKRSGELLGLLQVVFFAPEDLSIIKNGPQYRRKFMDMRMSQLDKGYLQYLINYQKLLNERNNLLKQISLYPALRETLDGWDRQLVENGIEIVRKREQFVKHLNEIMRETHGKLTGGREEIQVSYEENVRISEMEDALRQRRNQDIKNGTTGIGPHRDDLRFTSNSIDIRHYGSQGQQRTAALSMKMSEIHLIEESTGDKPVLLLDDVLSELDHHRQEYLLNNISGIQAMISCTGLDDFVSSRMVIDQIFRVEEGKVFSYEGSGKF